MRLFDDKVPTYEEYRYNGIKGGDKWRLKVRGYWLSKCPQLMPILNAIELSDTKVTKEMIMRAAGTSDDDSMNDVISSKELTMLSALIYGF